MTEPIVRPRVWDEIWQGRSPDPLVVASVAAAERAVLGAAGASAVAHEMAASVLGNACASTRPSNGHSVIESDAAIGSKSRAVRMTMVT